MTFEEILDQAVAMLRRRGRVKLRALKASLISPTESIAAEVKPYGIDAVCIYPAGVDSKGYREAFGSRGRQETPKLMEATR